MRQSRFAHEGRQPEFGLQPPIAVEEIAARNGREERIMGRQSGLQLLEEIGPLQELDAVVAINKPFGFGIECPNHFLQAQHIRIDIDKVGHQRLMQPAAPCIQGNDAQYPVPSPIAVSKSPVARRPTNIGKSARPFWSLQGNPLIAWYRFGTLGYNFSGYPQNLSMLACYAKTEKDVRTGITPCSPFPNLSFKAT